MGGVRGSRGLRFFMAPWSGALSLSGEPELPGFVLGLHKIWESGL